MKADVSGKESSAQVEAGHEETRQSHEAGRGSGLRQCEGTEPSDAASARCQKPEQLLSGIYGVEGVGSCPTSLLQHPMGPAVIILGVLAYLTTPLLVTPSSSLVLLAWGESSLGKAPESMPRVLPGKQLTGTL